MDLCWVKMSHRIKISLAFCLIFWPFTLICLEIGHWRGKNCLLDHLFILHPCIKHNDLFSYIYVITAFTKCFHEFFCYYSLLLLLKSSRLDLGRHWVTEEIRDNGSSFIRILTTQKKILHIYKLGCLIMLASKEINHSWSHSTFFMYLMAVMSHSMLLVLLVNRPACVSTFKYHLFTIYILRKRYQGLFSTQPLL